MYVVNEVIFIVLRRRTAAAAVTVATREKLSKPEISADRRSPSPPPDPVTRATATGDWSSPRGPPLRTRPSTGSPRTRRRRISATVCRTCSSSAGSATAAVVWISSVASGRPASKTARDPCDRAARLNNELN